MKPIKIFDIVIFSLSATNMILWLLRANYSAYLYQENEINAYFTSLFYPMVIALFLLPTIIVARTYKKRVSLLSYPFFSLLFCFITLAVIFYKN